MNMRMSEYINPIPSVDDEEQGRTVSIQFTFPHPVTKIEAAENINQWFKRHSLDPDAIKLTGDIGIYYRREQRRLGVNDRDPKGYGPRYAHQSD